MSVFELALDLVIMTALALTITCCMAFVVSYVIDWFND